MMFAGLGDIPDCAEDDCLLLQGAPCNTCRMPDGSIVFGVNTTPNPANPPPTTVVQTPSSTPSVLLPGGIDCLDPANASDPACKSLCANPLYAGYPSCKTPFWKKAGYVVLGVAGLGVAALAGHRLYQRRRRL